MRTFDSRYRRRRDARLTVEQVKAAHTLYVRKGWSLRVMGRVLAGPLGYASAKSCANSLWEQFVAAGLPRRDRIAATVAASTTHGLRSRSQTAEQRAGYNKLRRQRRDRQLPCIAHNRRGDPCPHPSMIGSEFCFSHDPDTSELRLAILAAARARLPLDGGHGDSPVPNPGNQ